MSMMALGFAIFLLGVVGLEVISFQFLRGEDVPQYLYRLEVAIEEFLEMIGITIVLYGAVQLSLANFKRQIAFEKAGTIR